MDRSFLSQPSVIAAAQKFVCIRLTTYENADEAEFLRKWFRGGSGELENTTFTILSPDASRSLVRASRSMGDSLHNVREATEAMNRIAQLYAGQLGEGLPELPKIPNVRLALDVAACDNRPLVVVATKDAAKGKALEEALRKLAWSKEFLGQLVYAPTSPPDQLKAVEGAADREGLFVIQPDRYGLKGRTLAWVGLDAKPEALAETLRRGARQFQSLDEPFGEHIQEGKKAGVFWETRIPVTDPQELRARRSGPPPER
jgi:hypothetical protein